ncbi:MAG: single-stranded-DNA-specific exonuclease RecJ [Planctomycetia bacterium]|nr:single-stranded-DNA-specific exonuclease RecJ [Planctomycetia bacterium]
MARHWRIHVHDADRIAALRQAADVPSLVAQLLIARGINDGDVARSFLDPKLTGLRDPMELPGMIDAVARESDAEAKRRRIIIYGDYDADGMTGTSILLLCLRMLGADVGYYVPNRLDEGYGLSTEALATLAAQGASMVVTVDCGIASLKEADEARRLGLELIVTDHHGMADRLPDAAAIVHPRLPGHSYPFGDLCGAGVAFKLAWALCQQAAEDRKRVAPAHREFLLTAVGLAAIGTVADVVPLIDENRVLVLHGLASLAQRSPLGLSKLMKLTKLDAKPALSSEDIAFTLAPRLNAAGRLGQAQLAVELMTTDRPDRADALAEYIDELNKSRDSLERSVYLSANKQAQQQFDPHGDAALVLADHGWHVGVIGIVAGRLAEKYHRPVLIVSLDELGQKPGIGSARSVPGFNLHQALAACSHRLLSHGGHAAAAGFKVDPKSLDAFRSEFCELAAERISAEDRVAELWIDAETPFAALTLPAVRQVERLAPFGQGNVRPLLCTTGVKLVEPPRPLGADGRHLSLKLHQQGAAIRGLAFGKAEWAEGLTAATTLSIAYRPVINNFRGRETVELHVVDWQADPRQGGGNGVEGTNHLPVSA